MNVQIESSKPKHLATIAALFAFYAMPVDEAQAQWQEQQRIVEDSIQAGELFGSSVHISAESVFIAAKERADGNGAVFIGSASSDPITSLVSLNPPADQNNERGFFGHVISECDGVLFISAHRKNVPQGPDLAEVQSAGSVHVYNKDSAGAWQWSQTLNASDAKASDQFGSSLACDAQTLVVSSPRRDSRDIVNSGAVYVFEASESGQWAQTQIIEAPQPVAGELFGNRIALAQGHLLVGSHLFDGQGANEGRVFAYNQNTESSSWQLSQTLQAPAPAPNAQFGFSLDLHGDLAVIGAPRETVDGVASGAVHVFAFSGSTWQPQARVVPDIPSLDVEFGSHVDLAPDQRWLAVGSPLDSTAALFAGAIHMFSKENATWSEKQKLIASQARLFDEFGARFHLRDNLLLVGVRNDDGAGQQAGAAYLFETEDDQKPASAPLGSLLSLSLVGGGLLALRRRYESEQ